ncbi:hypothetical protein AV530_001574 [Patagioenas fasciata monilis]|uniref:Uncharacterized protein n=1 Tax=Patagioenas fasciata monilis TaxID=372326 RepID=A0A1V4K577_PATFA|nr:hypothetical protein AV530_001574 [Patagioenas fasciata monilis]
MDTPQNNSKQIYFFEVCYKSPQILKKQSFLGQRTIRKEKQSCFCSGSSITNSFLEKLMWSSPYKIFSVCKSGVIHLIHAN